MTIAHQEVDPHLNYFLCLESDIQGLTRWIEFSQENENVYSIELARLLMTACSEVDVIARRICRSINPARNAKGILLYQSVLCEALPMLPDASVEIQRFGMTFHPWLNWRQPNSPPNWWQGNNKVKHQRAEYFKQANLKNVLNASAALLLLLILYYRSQGNQHFPSMHLFNPRNFAFEDGYIVIPDGAHVPWD